MKYNLVPLHGYVFMSIMIWLKNKVANNYIHPETCFCTRCSDLHDTHLYNITNYETADTSR